MAGPERVARGLAVALFYIPYYSIMYYKIQGNKMLILVQGLKRKRTKNRQDPYILVSGGGIYASIFEGTPGYAPAADLMESGQADDATGWHSPSAIVFAAVSKHPGADANREWWVVDALIEVSGKILWQWMSRESTGDEIPF